MSRGQTKKKRRRVSPQELMDYFGLFFEYTHVDGSVAFEELRRLKQTELESAAENWDGEVPNPNLGEQLPPVDLGKPPDPPNEDVDNNQLPPVDLGPVPDPPNEEITINQPVNVGEVPDPLNELNIDELDKIVDDFQSFDFSDLDNLETPKTNEKIESNDSDVNNDSNFDSWIEQSRLNQFEEFEFKDSTSDAPKRKAAILGSAKALKACEKQFPDIRATDKSDLKSCVEEIDKASEFLVDMKIAEAEQELSDLWCDFFVNVGKKYDSESIYQFPEFVTDLDSHTKEAMQCIERLVCGGTRSMEENQQIEMMAAGELKEAASFGDSDDRDKAGKDLEKLRNYLKSEDPLAGLKALELCQTLADMWNQFLGNAFFGFANMCEEAVDEVASLKKVKESLECGTKDIPKSSSAIRNFLAKLPQEQDRIIRLVTTDRAKRLHEQLERLINGANECKANLNEKDVEFVKLVIERYRKTSDDINFEGYNNAKICLEKMQDCILNEQLAIDTMQSKSPIEANDLSERFANVADEVPTEDLLQLAKQMNARVLVNFGPGPLGNAEFDLSGHTYPEIKFVEESSTIHFEKTQAVPTSNDRAYVMPIGLSKIGDIFEINGEKVTVLVDKMYTWKLPGIKEDSKELWRGVSKETYKEVEIRELEHLVDFKYAFTIGILAVAKAINQLSNNSYSSKQQAIEALVKSLHPRLVPQNPFDESSWTQHLKTATMNLCELSIERDRAEKGGTHSPKGYKITYDGKKAIIEPEFKDTSLSTKDIISLDRI